MTKLPPIPPDAIPPARWRCRACKQDVDLKAAKPCGCETSPSPWEIVPDDCVSNIKLQLGVKTKIVCFSAERFPLFAFVYTKIDLKKPFKSRFIGICFGWPTSLRGFWF